MKNNKIVKWSLAGLGVLFLAYVGSIVWFEAQLGMNQPQGSTSIVIATFNDDNERHERVVRLERIDGQNYIAANHWPRAWYKQALGNPNVEVKMPGNDSVHADMVDIIQEKIDLFEKYRTAVVIADGGIGTLPDHYRMGELYTNKCGSYVEIEKINRRCLYRCSRNCSGNYK